MAVGLKNRYWSGSRAVYVFVLISVLFKVARWRFHQKVDVFYKYKAGICRLGALGTMNQRTGALPRTAQWTAIDSDFFYH